MRHLPGEIFKHPDNDFKTPSELVKAYQPVGEIDVPHVISWRISKEIYRRGG